MTTQELTVQELRQQWATACEDAACLRVANHALGEEVQRLKLALADEQVKREQLIFEATRRGTLAQDRGAALDDARSKERADNAAIVRGLANALGFVKAEKAARAIEAG